MWPGSRHHSASRSWSPPWRRAVPCSTCASGSCTGSSGPSSERRIPPEQVGDDIAWADFDPIEGCLQVELELYGASRARAQIAGPRPGIAEPHRVDVVVVERRL